MLCWAGRRAALPSTTWPPRYEIDIACLISGMKMLKNSKIYVVASLAATYY